MTETTSPDVQTLPDIAAYGRELDEHGYCVVPDVLTTDLLERVRAVLDRLIAEDIESGIPLTYGPKRSNRRVRAVLQRDDVFAELALNPVALAMAKQSLGYDDVMLSIMSANITGPGGDEGIGVLHTDQSFLPGYFPRKMIVNMAFFLDDYTKENGATVVVPGSQLSETQPSAEMVPESELDYLTGPAGSLGIWDGFVHHATGLNKTADQYRRGIITTYFPPFLRGHENYTRTLPREMLDKHPGLAAITGFEEWSSLGAVYGGELYDPYYLRY